MATVRHLILTRFNLRFGEGANQQLDVDWLNGRFRLFDQFCFPTVRSQTRSDFEWLVLFDAETPESIRERIAQYQHWQNFIPVYVAPFQTAVGMKVVQAHLGENKPDFLVTTRLDNDDGLSRTFVEQLRRRVEFSDRTILEFPRGFVWQNYRAYLDRHRANPFTSLVEPLGGKSDAPIKTIYSGSHYDVERLGRIVEVSQEPAWIQAVHGGNLENQQRGVRHPVRALADNFAIDPSLLDRSENPLVLNLDKIRTQIKANVTELWHSARRRLK